VLGMHRSGTSATARVLSLLGAGLPKTLVGALASNPAGFWEPERLVAAHDRMLAEVGSVWYDFRSLDTGRLSAARQRATREELAALLGSEYGHAALIVVKDPRICRFVSLYKAVLESLDVEPSCVIPLRNPLAVIASLQARDAMSEGYAGLLWLRHALDAEAGTRGWPRAVVSYETLLEDWRSTARAVAERLGADFRRSADDAAPEIEAFLTAELRHHSYSREDLASRADIAHLVRDAYEALLCLERDPDDGAALSRLDQIRAEFNAGCEVFGGALFGELGALEARFATAWRDLSAAAEHARTQLREREAELANARAELASLRAAPGRQSGR
jgi:hypothetical protein